MSRPVRAAIFVILTVALLAVVVWLAFGQRMPASTDPHASQDAALSGGMVQDDIRADVVENAEPAQREARERAPIFPVGEDPAKVVAALLPAAQAGDPAAACRVAVERLACDTATYRRDEVLDAFRREEERAAGQASTHGEAAMAVLLARRAERDAAYQVALIERGVACARMPPTLRDDGIDWLARAAATGHPESVLRYATGQSLGFIEGLGDRDSTHWGVVGNPGFDAWRRDAPAMLQRMLASGHPEAAFVLSLAYRDDATPLNGLISNDAVEAAAMSLLLKHLSPHPTRADPLRGLDADQRRQATSRFAALRDGLKGQRMDRRVLEAGLDPAPLALMETADASGPPCQP